MAPDARRVLEAFRRVMVEDVRRGRRLPVEHYQRLFGGFEASIAREYECIVLAQGDSRPSSASPESSAAESRDAPVPPDAPAGDMRPEPASGTSRIGPYRLLGELGRGAQAVVHLAEDTRMGRRVALKVLAPQFAAPEHVARLRREAEAASRLEHPGICTVYEAVFDGASAYIAMRLVEGETLARRIARSRAEGAAVVRLPADDETDDLTRVLRTGERVARALHAAHEAGLVHRDVKPANIMIAPDGEPVLLDFGLARFRGGRSALSVSGGVGTPSYMSPEQVEGRADAGGRACDVYSLGATMYECVTMHCPYEAPTLEALCRLILDGALVPARRRNRAITRDLDVVLGTALERDPRRRYASARAFADDLRRVRLREPVFARPVGSVGRAIRWSERNRAAALGVLCTLTALAGGAAACAWALRRPGGAAAQADPDRLVALRDRDAALDEVRELRATLVRARAAGLVAVSREVASRDPALGVLLAVEAHRTDPGPATAAHLRSALRSLDPQTPLSSLTDAKLSERARRAAGRSLTGGERALYAGLLGGEPEEPAR